MSQHHVGVYPSGRSCGGMMVSVYFCPSHFALVWCQRTSFLQTSCCAHGWWWAMAYTACTVFAAPHSDAEYTGRTALCTCTHTARSEQ